MTIDAEETMSDGSKNVGHGAGERPTKVLVSLENLTSLRGSDLLQNVYLVVFGYQMKPVTNHIRPLESCEIPLGDPVNDYFFGWHSELKLTQKGRLYTFPCGLPLYYGNPATTTSMYLGVLSMDVLNKDKFRKFWEGTSAKPTKNGFYQNALGVGQGREIKDLMTEAIAKHRHLKNQKRRHESAITTRARMNSVHNEGTSHHDPDAINSTGGEAPDTEPRELEHVSITRIETVEPLHPEDWDLQNKETELEFKNVFSRLIKRFETEAIRANHQIRYTNVFTFREDDNWLEGGHKDWGDHRMAVTLNIEVG